MTAHNRIITEIITQQLETWKSQPGYADPRVKAIIDSSGEKLTALANQKNYAELLKTIEEIKAQVEAIYNPATPDHTPALLGALPNIVNSAESYNNLTPEQIKEDLEKQYKGRLATMHYFGIIDDINNPEVECIDQKKRKAPTHADIWTELSNPANSAKMEAIRGLKKPKLIVTPIGMPLKTLAEKIASQNGRLKKDGKPMEQNAVEIHSMVFNSDITGDMKYFPSEYKKEGHEGKTKQELLDNQGSPFPGWQVVIVEGEQEVQDVNKTAHEFLEEWKNKNYDPLTTEEIMMLHPEGVIAPFGDANEAHPYNNQKWEWALGSYLASIGEKGALPDVSWRGFDRFLFLSCGSPVFRGGKLGPRRSVRVF